MFTVLEDRRTYLIKSFVVHQVIAVLAPWVLALLSSKAAHYYSSRYLPLYSVVPHAYLMLSPWIFGFIAALGARRVLDKSAGRYVWIIPSCLLVFAVFHDGALFGLKETLLEYLYPKDVGEGAIGYVMVTYPAFACCAYVAGLAFPGFTWLTMKVK